MNSVHLKPGGNRVRHCGNELVLISVCESQEQDLSGPLTHTICANGGKWKILTIT